MATISLDTPAGTITMSPYETVLVGTGPMYFCAVQKVNGQYRWMPVHTEENVTFTNP
jgi:hypothetical protein